MPLSRVASVESAMRMRLGIFNVFCSLFEFKSTKEPLLKTVCLTNLCSPTHRSDIIILYALYTLLGVCIESQGIAQSSR